jgi:serine/threonine-protein kinase HipA
VLSAWPVTGPGPNHLDYEKLRLAMALRGKNTHYRLRDIQRRHFNDTAQKCGLGPDMEPVIDEVLSRVAGAGRSRSQPAPGVSGGAVCGGR